MIDISEVESLMRSSARRALEKAAILILKCNFVTHKAVRVTVSNGGKWKDKIFFDY